jgi:hypothetical protein
MSNKVPPESILQLIERFDRNRNVCAITAIERQIAATDKQIDSLVYELYGLTEEEIRIEEGRQR